MAPPGWAIRELPSPQTTPRHHLSPPDAICRHCGALLFKALMREKGSTLSNPVFGICCGAGKVALPNILPTPLPLAELFINDRSFANNIRTVNNMFAMTSVGAKDVTPTGHGPPTYVIAGQLSHRIGHLLPDGEADRRPMFAQLYFHDVQNELVNRMAGVADVVAAGVVDLLQRLLHYINPYVRIFRTAGERLREQPALDLQVGFQRVTRAERGTHAAPTSDDVAGILVCSDGNIDRAGLDIVLERRPLLDGGYAPLERMWHFDARYMALQYPLLFPWGDFGWTCDLKSARPGAQGGAGDEDDRERDEEHFDDANEPGAKKDQVTFREWAAYRLMTRKDDGFSFLLGRRLLQQAVVDIWASVELCRLRWVETNQNQIRSECYQGVFLLLFSYCF